MLLGVQVPGFPGLVGGLVNMSCLGESPHHHHPHHHHPAHHAAPHLIHPGHNHQIHHSRLMTRVSSSGEETVSPGHSPTERRRVSPERPQQELASTAGSLSSAAQPRPDRYAPILRLARVQIHPPRNPDKPLTPFGISDILTGRIAKRKATDDAINGDVSGEKRKEYSPHLGLHPPGSHIFGGMGGGEVGVAGSHHAGLSPGSIVRPWADSTLSSAGPGRGSPISSRDESESEEEEIEVDDEPKAIKSLISQNSSQSPLDALLQMTSKTFDGMDASSMNSDDSSRRDQLSLFSKSQPAKKRRKSRTAFTNQQIYELEKRFLYQKYLTPADRDEIASNLGLTNAQVITWFQNRRAKLKRDLEELKADVSAARSISPNLAPDLDDIGDRHPVYGSLEDLQLLQKNNGHIKSPKSTATSNESQGDQQAKQASTSPPQQPKAPPTDNDKPQTDNTEEHLNNSQASHPPPPPPSTAPLKSPTSPSNTMSASKSSPLTSGPTSPPPHDVHQGSHSPPRVTSPTTST